MKTKYFCLNCGHAFDALDTSDFDKLGACPKCTSDNYIEDDIDIADALREWLDPWHPASEPPEHDGEYETTRICNGKMYRQYSHFLNGKWNFVHRTISDPTHWRNMPPMPVKS